MFGVLRVYMQRIPESYIIGHTPTKNLFNYLQVDKLNRKEWLIPQKRERK